MSIPASATAPSKTTAKQSMLVLESLIYAYYSPNKKPSDPDSHLVPIADKNMAAFEAYHKLTEGLVNNKGWLINSEHIYKHWQAVGSRYMHSASCSYLLDDMVFNITLELQLTPSQLKPKALTLTYHWYTHNNQNVLTIPIKYLTEESCEQVMARVDDAVAEILNRAVARINLKNKGKLAISPKDSLINTANPYKQLLFKPEIFDVDYIKEIFLYAGKNIARNVKVIAFAANLEQLVVYVSYIRNGKKGIYGFGLKDYADFSGHQKGTHEIGLKRYSYLSDFEGNNYRVKFIASPYFEDSDKLG